MIRKALLVAAAGMLMGSAYVAPASATSYLAPVTMDSQNTGNIQNAAMVTKTTVVKKKRRNGTVVTRRTTTRRWTYNAGRNGMRYRARRSGYNYYYNGYYYARPWWTIGVPGVNLCIGC